MGLIDDVLSSLTIEDILPYLNGSYVPSGNNYSGNCPTGHISKSGKSFNISAIMPTFNCFNCGIKGNYIHLVELIKTGKCSTGNGYTESFKDALFELAELVGIDTQNYENVTSQESSIFDTITSVISYYTRFMTDDIYAALNKRYGLKKEFCVQEGIGYGLKCPSKELLDIYSEKELLETGLFNKTSSGGIFHIFQDRITFPYKHKGRIVYASGRKTSKTLFKGSKENIPKYFKQYIHSEKRPYVSPSIKNICVTHKGNTDFLMLTEGIVDYLQLKQYNISSACLGTTQIPKDAIDALVSFCSNFKVIYLCNDNDANGAGTEGAIKSINQLIKLKIYPKLILLPRDGKDKIDVSEYIRDNGVDSFLSIKDTHSYTLPEYMLHKIPKDTPQKLIVEKLEPLYPVLNLFPKDDKEIFVSEVISKYFKIPKVSPYLKSIRTKITESSPDKITTFDSGEHDIEDVSNYTIVSSGQDYVDNLLYYTITKPILTRDKKGARLENQAYLIRSDRKMIEIIDHQITSSGIVLNKRISPAYKSLNWSLSEGDFSVKKYLAHETTVSPGTLFTDIVSIFKKYIYFTTEGTAEHLAIVIMTSYVYMCFHTTGYVHLWAEKRSGKTTALEIMNELGYNSRLSSSITDAAIFRMIELYRPLLLIDEAENLNPSQKQRDNSPSEKLELFKSGYKKTGAATRCEGQDHAVLEFSNYCPKVFSSIKNLDATLEDRTIVHAFKRAPKEAVIPQLVPDKMQGLFSELRDKLHIFGLENAKKICDYYEALSVYEEELVAHKVTHRSREIWGSYLAVGLFIDSCLEESYVFDLLLDLALFTSENKALFENSDSKPLVLLEKFYLWTRLKRQNLMHESIHKDMYFRRDIIKEFIQEFLRKDDDEGAFIYTHYTSVKQTLMRFHVIDKNSEVNRGGLEKTTYLFIPPEKMLEALKTYKSDCCDEVLLDIDEFLENKTKYIEEGID